VTGSADHADLLSPGTPPAAHDDSNVSQPSCSSRPPPATDEDAGAVAAWHLVMWRQSPQSLGLGCRLRMRRLHVLRVSDRQRDGVR
jgi:hypothetical protein